MNDDARPPQKIALTCGDPAGVGPEIVARWLSAYPEWCDKVVPIGPAKWIASLGFEPVGAASSRGTGILPVSGELENTGRLPGPRLGVAVGAPDFVATPGAPDEAGQRVALAAMQAAADGCKTGVFSAVVTGPVNKAGLQSIGYKHPGQTEFFAEQWGGEPVMGFAGEKLRVILATWHIPFSQVPAALDKAALARAAEAAVFLAKSLGATAPRIAVCGLNPHAGENGVLGADERDRLDPWLSEIRMRHPGLSKCLPGDTVFWRQLRGDFDAVIALYHDQGLAPVKTLEFDSAVNITLGLPHIRTSPDHGTAYDIAGRGVADFGSWDHAVKLAAKLSAR